MSLLTLITPGGGRPEAFSLCEKYMKRQTIWSNSIQWIVADDDPADPVICTLNQEHIFGDLKWKPGVNTMRYNLDAALTKVNPKSEYISIIQNDDFFSKNYLQVYLDLLKHCDIVGIANNRYYSVKIPGYKEMHNYSHSSLCTTAFKKSVLPLFYKAIHSGELYADIELWKLVNEKKLPSVLIRDSSLAVGMKNLPGRPGVGIGHHKTDYYFDPKLDKLRQWIGDDVELYRPIVEQLKAERTAKKTVAV